MSHTAAVRCHMYIWYLLVSFVRRDVRTRISGKQQKLVSNNGDDIISKPRRACSWLTVTVRLTVGLYKILSHCGDQTLESEAEALAHLDS